MLEAIGDGELPEGLEWVESEMPSEYSALLETYSNYWSELHHDVNMNGMLPYAVIRDHGLDQGLQGEALKNHIAFLQGINRTVKEWHEEMRDAKEQMQGE